jgi:hypothetical protein
MPMTEFGKYMLKETNLEDPHYLKGTMYHSDWKKVIKRPGAVW